MKLRPGRFYVTEAGARWCCYFVNYDQNVATCIEGATMRCEIYFPDGILRGRPEDTLVSEELSGDRDLLRRFCEMALPGFLNYNGHTAVGNSRPCPCVFCKLIAETIEALEP